MKIVGFNEKLFIYFEEHNFCNKIRDLGKELYIYPGAKVRSYWRARTKKEEKRFMDKYFISSRYFYFKKHFGKLKALLTELFLRFDFKTLLMLLAVGYFSFLIFHNIEESLHFGGEIGQNYLQIKNYIENRQFPLVGPPTGRSWLTLGPLFYWMMIPLFILFNFNPVMPAYFFGVVSLLMALINYKFVKQWFGNTVSYVSTIFILISPLWLLWTRRARFYFLATLFSYFYYYFLFSGLKGKTKHLYYSAFFIAVMLNFHLSAAVLIPIFSLFIILRKQEIRLNVGKLFLYFIIPNIPFLIVSIRDDFQPVLKTAAWFFYRIAGFIGLVPKNNIDATVLSANIKSLIIMFGEHFYYERSSATIVMGLFFILFTIWLSALEFKRRKLTNTTILLITFWLFYLVLFVHGNPPSHYYSSVLIVFPIIIGVFIKKLTDRVGYKKLIVFSLVLVTVFSNVSYFLSDSWFRKGIQNNSGNIKYFLQKEVARTIVEDAKGWEFSLKRVGAFDYYGGNFAQNYQYLLWWMGNEPRENQQIIYTIYEESSRYQENENVEEIFKDYDVIVTKDKL